MRRTLIITSLTLMSLIPGGRMTQAEGGSAEARWQQIERLIAEYEQEVEAPAITVNTLMRRLDADPPVLLDAREPFEREISMLPGAISREAFEAHPERYRDQEIVVYCTIGHRSAYYTRRLVAQGFAAQNLRGSLLMWMHAGGELVTPEGESTRRAHVYGEKWNVAPEGYETIVEDSWWARTWSKIRFAWDHLFH